MIIQITIMNTHKKQLIKNINMKVIMTSKIIITITTITLITTTEVIIIEAVPEVEVEAEEVEAAALYITI